MSDKIEKFAIKTCSCKSEFQDRRYGKNKRVHNLVTRIGVEWRCTVCKKER